MDDQGLDRVPRRRLYEEVEERLRTYAERAEMEPGARFPPERVLAERLGVSRTSVRQAIVSLEVQGIAEVRQGDGVYLVHELPLGRPLAQMIERRRRLPDVLEAREALECKNAELAALRRTDEDLAAIERALEEMAADIAGGGIGESADALFHRAITRASGNQLLEKLMDELRGPISESRLESLSEPRRPPQSLNDHRVIAAAIRAGDPQGAREAMRIHLQHVSDVRLLKWQLDEEAIAAQGRDSTTASEEGV